LTRDIPGLVKQAIKPIFDSLVSCCPGVGVKEGAFDWALHPGGQAVLEGVKDAMGLKEEQLRASREIYRTRGNSSSPTVLAVLDKLRSMGEGRDHVIATSFGPGLCVEMVMLERCR
jgi:type III polyketide synthase